MPVSSTTLRLLMDAGLAGDELVRIVESIDRDMTPKRSSGAARQAAYRAREKAKKDGRDITSDVTSDANSDVTEPVTQRSPVSRPPARIYKNPLTQSSNKGFREDNSARHVTPCDELCKVLDREHAKAVVEHRQRIKKPLTQHAAKLLAGKFAKCPDANAAADTMISNGWQGFEPEWLDGRGGRGTGPPKASYAEDVRRIGEAMEREAEERNGH